MLSISLRTSSSWSSLYGCGVNWSTNTAAGRCSSSGGLEGWSSGIVNDENRDVPRPTGGSEKSVLVWGDSFDSLEAKFGGISPSSGNSFSWRLSSGSNECASCLSSATINLPCSSKLPFFVAEPHISLSGGEPPVANPDGPANAPEKKSLLLLGRRRGLLGVVDATLLSPREEAASANSEGALLR